MLTTFMLFAPLTVILEDIEKDTGDLYISVQTADQYMQDEGVAGSIETPERGTMSLAYEVAPGTYAVSIWHDFNGNGRFDYREDGWPLDGFGQSGRGGRSFDDVKIDVPESGAIVRIGMNYPD